MRLATGALVAVPFLISCFGPVIPDSDCATTSGDVATSAVFDVHWENAEGGIEIVRDSSFARTFSGRIIGYDCTRDACRKNWSTPAEFFYAVDGDGKPDSTSWNENTLVMARRWKITLASTSRLAFTISTSGRCTHDYAASSKPFLDE